MKKSEWNGARREGGGVDIERKEGGKKVKINRWHMEIKKESRMEKGKRR